MVDQRTRASVCQRGCEEIRSARDEIPPISDHAAKIPRLSLRSSRATVPLRRKPEMHHVAVGDFVLLAFQPQLADVARAGLAAALERVARIERQRNPGPIRPAWKSRLSPRSSRATTARQNSRGLDRNRRPNPPA